MRRLIPLAAALAVFSAALLYLPAVHSAPLEHRNGCHRWHSCPSDTGSYVCGDLGYYDQCGYGPPAAPTIAPRPKKPAAIPTKPPAPPKAVTKPKAAPPTSTHVPAPKNTPVPPPAPTDTIVPLPASGQASIPTIAPINAERSVAATTSSQRDSNSNAGSGFVGLAIIGGVAVWLYRRRQRRKLVAAPIASHPRMRR